MVYNIRQMKIIFAQGNPGPKYDNTRHNVGFAVLDHFAQLHGVTFGDKPKFFAHVAELSLAGEKTLLVKPTTYYNETGRSARTLVDFYKLDPAEDLLVVHDDLALDFGTLRTREKGSDAGNNGIRSLNAHLGPDYARLRIGIANELRNQIPDADFVLSRFSREEDEAVQTTISPKVSELINSFISESHEITSHRLIDTSK